MALPPSRSTDWGFNWVFVPVSNIGQSECHTSEGGTYVSNSFLKRESFEKVSQADVPMEHRRF